jgi:hypothetical protein
MDLLPNIAALNIGPETENSQSQSLFFTKLPADLRQEIYSLVFGHYE